MKNLNAQTIRLVSHESISEHIIHAEFSDGSINFTVVMSDMNDDGKELSHFYLSEEVMCSDEDIQEMIHKALFEGEDDSNENIDLYLAIREAAEIITFK